MGAPVVTRDDVVHLLWRATMTTGVVDDQISAWGVQHFGEILWVDYLAAERVTVGVDGGGGQFCMVVREHLRFRVW